MTLLITYLINPVFQAMSLAIHSLMMTFFDNCVNK